MAVAAATWLDAVEGCAAQTPGHSHLVVIDSEAERMEVGAKFPGDATWLGLSDLRGEGIFAWVTDEQVTVPPNMQPPWGIGLPDGANPDADCVRLTTSDFYDDINCDMSQLPYLCECDDHASDPERYRRP
jgi:hypothetical protein